MLEACRRKDEALNFAARQEICQLFFCVVVVVARAINRIAPSGRDSSAR
jgi:hypothetical protein